MKRLMMVALVMFAVGCGKDSADHAAKANALADRGCACKGDEACLEKVKVDWEKWEDEAKKGKRPDEATMAKIMAAEDRIEKCAEGE